MNEREIATTAIAHSAVKQLGPKVETGTGAAPLIAWHQENGATRVSPPVLVAGRGSVPARSFSRGKIAQKTSPDIENAIVAQTKAAIVTSFH